MLLTSGSYLIFLAIIFFAYWLLFPRRLALWFLLLASYYFYALWNPWSLLFLLLISLADFASGLSIAAIRRTALRKLLLFSSILIDVGCLFGFKYFNFFSSSAAGI